MEDDKRMLESMGVEPGVSDQEIIKLLDDPGKYYTALSWIQQKKITSAIPRLVELVKIDRKISSKTVAICEVLNDFGNREWVENAKEVFKDTRSSSIIRRIKVARLLGKIGDYSEFDLIQDNLNHKIGHIRQLCIQALGNFCHGTGEISDSAITLLEAVAVSEPDLFSRRSAIESLDKAAKTKPELSFRLLDILQANLDHPDEMLRLACEQKLKRLRLSLMTDDEVIRHLDSLGRVDDMRSVGYFQIVLNEIKKRKMVSAVPRLMKIVKRQDSKLNTFGNRLTVAKTLLALGNTDWIEPIKQLLAEPDNSIGLHRYSSVLDLLARAGDYSQVALKKYTGHNKANIRSGAVRRLSSFAEKHREAVLPVAAVLRPMAQNDPESSLRKEAITALYKLTEMDSAVGDILMEALVANLDSADESMQSYCTELLQTYRQSSEQP